MKGRTFVAASLVMLLLFTGLVPPFSALPARAVSTHVVISQVYGAGGNSGVTYNADYVELFNLGTASQSLAGWSIQYTSATGTGNFGANAGQLTELPAVTLAPGNYLLVQVGAAGAVGLPLPTPDVTDPVSPINMSGSAGKVALVDTVTSLGCNGGSTPCTPAQAAHIIDLVGFGNANYFEGAAPAPTLSSILAAFRAGSGCTDTDQNGADFTALLPAPRNSASPATSCTASTPPTGTGTANPSSQYATGSVLLTVAVTPGANPPSTGLVVAADISAIGGPATQVFYDNGASGDVTAEDNVFSFQWTIGPGATPGAKNLPVTITDARGRTGSTTINLTVLAPTNPAGAGSANPSSVLPNGATTLTVDVMPGTNPPSTNIGVRCDLRAIGLPNPTYLDNGGSGNSFAANVTLGGAAPGSFTLPCTVTDAQGRNGSASIGLTVTAVANPDVTASKTGPSILIGSAPAVYTISYSNIGSGGAAGVTVVDTYPAGLTYTSDTSGKMPTVDTGARTVTWNLDPIVSGGSGSFDVTFSVPGAATIADNRSVTNQVAIATTTVGDPTGNNSGTVTATVRQPLSIGEIQGTADTSPHEGETALVRGVVYAKILLRQTDGSFNNGVFIQSKPGTDDGNPNTSDGIYVYLGTGTNIGTYVPAVGDEIVFFAEVNEYFGISEMQSPFTFVTKLGGNNVIPPTEIMAGGAAADNAAREKWESMRVTIPDGSLVVAPTHYYSTYYDTEFFVVRSDSVPGQRTGYTRRIFRDQNNNPTPELNYMLSVEANVLKADAGQAAYDATQLPDANTYASVNALIGPLYYAFSKWTLEPETMPVVTPGLDPAGNNPPASINRLRQYTIQTFNVDNLYDYLDSPNSLCDFANVPAGSNPGCPAQYSNGSSANPPYDYPAANVAAYTNKIRRLAAQIEGPLHAPDVIAIEEAEAQDICTGGGELYSGPSHAGTGCDTTHAGMANTGYDGKIDVLQDLAYQIASDTGNAVIYDVANDTNATAKLPRGGDYRGIMVAYLYRADRVQLLRPSASDPLLGSRPGDPDADLFEHNQDVANPKALNGHDPAAPAQWLFDRPSTVALWRIHRVSTIDNDYVDVYTEANHFASGPNGRVPLRTAQATYNATQVHALKAADPNVLAVVLGDLNVYPDGYGTLLFYDGNSYGAVNQLASLQAEMVNTYYNEPLEARFSYTYNGTTQTLDQLFVTTALFNRLGAVRSVHLNADYSYTMRDAAAGLYNTSDHDPTQATFSFPTLANPVWLPMVQRGATPGR